MKLYKRKVVSGTSNVEKLEILITSTVEEPKHITALWFTEVTAAENSDAILRAYLERENIIDMSIKHLLSTMDAPARYWKSRLEVDIVLPVGQSLSVGCVSGGTATNLEVIAEYEITS